MTTPNQRRALALIALAVLIPTGLALAGQVTYPAAVPFVAGTPIRAADVNGALAALKAAIDDNHARITALEAQAAARRSYYAMQAGDATYPSGDVNAGVDDTWLNLPSVAIPLTLSAATKIRYQLFARIYNYGATVGTPTSCSVRIVTDDAGTALNPVSPTTIGDWNGILVGGDISPSNGEQVALSGLVTLAAGTYNLKAQVVRKATAGLANSGNCSIFRWPFSRAHFFVDTVP